MRQWLKQLDLVDRRRFVSTAAKLSLGVSTLTLMDQAVRAVEPRKVTKAKRLVYLFMAGGMSHVDTFDLKSGADNQSSTRPISTNVPGCQISQYLPTLAQQFDKLAVIRSLNTQTGDHEAGEYLMRTSYESIATELHPSLGPWLQKHLGRKSKSLPDSVTIAAPARHPGAGFLEPEFSPLPIADPNRGLENTKVPEYLTAQSFESRMGLINKFDEKFRQKYQDRSVKTYADFYSEATSLLASGELKAFDLSQEKPEVRDRYGRHSFGQGCLLARRLIESDVRCVEVNCGGWDMHNFIYEGSALPRLSAVMDQAVGNLIQDLGASGLLDETLIVLTTEFGRSPEVNFNVGRDHHPAAFCAFLAGAGVQGGHFFGQTDSKGFSVESDGVSPADLNATIVSALGVPLDSIVHSPTNRPFTVANDGQPIVKLLA